HLSLDFGENGFFDDALRVTVSVLFDGENLRPDFDGKLLNYVLPGLHELGSVLNEVIWTEAFGGSYIAGNREHVSALFIGHSGRDERTASLGRFHDDHPEGKTAQHSVPERKILGERGSAQGELGQQSAMLYDRIRQLPVLFRINRIQARTH